MSADADRADQADGVTRIASLAMYRDPPIVADATRQLWAYLRDRLRGAGMADVPARLDETIAYDAAWLDPRLLLAQACGHPFASRLRGRVRLIATPVYDHPGCIGAAGGSFIVVRGDAPARSIAELRGMTVAINDRGSNSGMNVLRHAVARRAGGARFFDRVIVSGGHVASIAMIAAGTADVAAIDCVTYGNLARHDAPRVAHMRILAETVKTPALPLITRGAASDAELAMLRDALSGFARDPAMAHVREILGLRGFEILPESAYEATIAAERDAVQRGYPELV